MGKQSFFRDVAREFDKFIKKPLQSRLSITMNPVHLFGCLVVLIASVVMSCGTTDVERVNVVRDIHIEFETDSSPVFQQPVKITCIVRIEYPFDRSQSVDFIASGYFETMSFEWAIATGESCWVDTTRSYVEHRHEITARPLVRGLLGIDAVVNAIPKDSTVAPTLKNRGTRLFQIN